MMSQAGSETEDGQTVNCNYCLHSPPSSTTVQLQQGEATEPNADHKKRMRLRQETGTKPTHTRAGCLRNGIYGGGCLYSMRRWIY